MKRISVFIPDYMTGDMKELRRRVAACLGNGAPAAYTLPKGARKKNVTLTGPLAARVAMVADAAGMSLSEVVAACWESPDVIVVSPVEMPPPDPEPERLAAPRAPKAVQDMMDGLAKRHTIIDRDISLGRWGCWVIVGGPFSVNPIPFDRDFGDEIADGIVVEDTIPWEYKPDEVEAWKARRHAEGKIIDWAFMTGDCETLAEAEESARRARLRASGEGVEALLATERRERLEVMVYKKKKMHIEAGLQAAARLEQYCAREGILGLPRGEASRVLLGRAEGRRMLTQ